MPNHRPFSILCLYFFADVVAQALENQGQLSPDKRFGVTVPPERIGVSALATQRDPEVIEPRLTSTSAQTSGPRVRNSSRRARFRLYDRLSGESPRTAALDLPSAEFQPRTTEDSFRNEPGMAPIKAKFRGERGERLKYSYGKPLEEEEEEEVKEEGGGGGGGGGALESEQRAGRKRKDSRWPLRPILPSFFVATVARRCCFRKTFPIV
ncbi:hypothetical protein KM043_015321 [Ampulex compressa]|nr:hypothetical protein KM043_015321 [Ampulex compressa]